MSMRVGSSVPPVGADEVAGTTGRDKAVEVASRKATLSIERAGEAGGHAGGPLPLEEMLPAPKPGALAALQQPSAAGGAAGSASGAGVGATAGSDGSSDGGDFASTVGSATTNSAISAMLEIGLAEIQSDQTMAVSQDDARKADLQGYLTETNSAISQIKDQAKDEGDAAWIEGVMGGVGAALSIGGAVAGPFAGAEGASFGMQLLGGTEMSAGILSTSGNLLSTTGDAISKGTAGQAELRHQADQKSDEADAGIYQEAESTSQQYRDQYNQMQGQVLSAIQSVIQGQGQAQQAAASNI